MEIADTKDKYADGYLDALYDVLDLLANVGGIEKHKDKIRDAIEKEERLEK